jgi:hypothetical protein
MMMSQSAVVVPAINLRDKMNAKRDLFKLAK